MFKLLRRSKNHNKSEKQNRSPKASRYSTYRQREFTSPEATTSKCSLKNEPLDNTVLPTVLAPRGAERATTTTTTRVACRAAIAELEDDLKDLGDDDDEDDNSPDGDVDDEVRAARCVVVDAVDVDRWDDSAAGKVGYFKRCRTSEHTRAIAQQKVNLAGTAANCTPVVVAAPARAASAKRAEPKVENENSHCTNSANKLNNKVFVFSKFNVDKINAIAGIATLGDDADANVDEAADGVPMAPTDSATANKSVSQNEEAVWQGHVLRSSADRYSKRSNNASPNRPSKQFNNSESTTIASSAKNAKGAANGTTAATAIRIGDRSSYSNNNSYQDINTRSPTLTVNNEIKYRNSDSAKRAQEKNSIAKRQSRLSLTLALGRTTTSEQIELPDLTANKHTSKLTQIGKSVRKSVFYKRSKSIEKESPKSVEVKQSALTSKLLSHPLENDKAEKRADAAASEGDRTRRAIQKSKAFLSEIFMARGRNQNRNRNHQQQQSNQSQSQSQSQSSSAPLPEKKYTPVISTTSANRNDHNHQQPRCTDSDLADVNYSDNSSSNCWQLHEPTATHLEPCSDPRSAPTNSHQITMFNNSAPSDGHLAADRVKSRKEREERATPSISVERLTPNGEPVRAHSVPYAGAKPLNASVTHPAEEHDLHNLKAAPTLNANTRTERTLIHENNIERNGVGTADTAYCIAAQPQNRYKKDHANNTQKCNQINHESDNAESSIKNSHNLENIGQNQNNRKVHSATTDNAPATTCEQHGATTANKKTNDNEFNERKAVAAASEVCAMGQTNAKCPEADNLRATTPPDFRESIVPEDVHFVGAKAVDRRSPSASRASPLPKITVSDCSGSGEATSTDYHGSPIEQEVFYDFDSNSDRPESRDHHVGVRITPINENLADDDEDGIEDEVFHDEFIPSTIQQNTWNTPLQSHRYNQSRLENVPEQEEDNDDDDDECDDTATGIKLDHVGGSPERNPLKSTNTSDSNLSNSFPDSGIGTDSQYSTNSSSSPSPYGGKQSLVSGDHDTATSAAAATTAAMRNSFVSPPHLPFVRDGNSTDCDETLLQFDDLDYITEAADTDPNERLVCIESISLPDVVVESTTGASGGQGSSGAAAMGGGEQIININGATGNSMGNVHFIPIHVEGDSGSGGQQKRRSVDDSVLGVGGKKSFDQLNGLRMKSTIEITEDACELQRKNTKEYEQNVNTLAEKLKQELNEQKSRHSVQLGDAQRNIQNLQAKINELQTNIEKLEQELSTKAWNVERLQGELKATQRDDACVRQRLKSLEEEKTNLRHKYNDCEDEFKRKYEELETRYQELEIKYNETKQLARQLQTQLASAQTEAEEWRKEVDKVRLELEDQIRILRNALENSEAERKICQDKWQKEFEMLRTQNLEREETLMTDCEWQLRQMQRQCKDKVDKVSHERHEALEQANRLQSELADREKQIDHLKEYQAEVKSLRGVVSEQERAIETLMAQIENMRTELQTTKTDLEEQMKAVKKIKLQCDNAISDKEREVVYRIHEVHNKAAAFWEDKLYTEMTRLKTELESVYVEERREALDKLQAEHIEELRALTTRYTANEDELRTEFNELQERYERKSAEFLELREKSDNALLQTRMHLDRADREYQKAMCREDERREALEESLRKEFEEEKAQMEEQFRERLSQVKEEFAKELQHTTHELAEKHRKELEEQKAKLKMERDEALQELNERHRKKLTAAEEQINDIKLRHQHDLADLKTAYDEEKSTLDKRDISNANEIEQLHRKCRCLTNLFEEMRMRYERRDPRPEDLREIAELRSRCESQERDLYVLTDRLRELQLHTTENGAEQQQSKGKPVKKPLPKTIPTSCDVIYEENEEHESSPSNNNASDDESTDEGSNEGSDESEEESEQNVEQQLEKENDNNVDILINGKQQNNTKNIDTLNEDDDESHMISTV